MSRQTRSYSKDLEYVRLIWVLWDLDGPVPITGTFDASPTSSTSTLKEILEGQLKDTHSFRVDASSINFWATTEDISLSGLKIQHLRKKNIENIATPTYPEIDFLSQLNGREKIRGIIHLFITAEKQKLNCKFWDSNRPDLHTSIYRVEIPPRSFRKPVSGLKELFAKEFSTQCHLSVEAENIKFYKPNDSTQGAVDKDNVTEIAFLSELNGKEKNQEIVHLFVSTERTISLNWKFYDPERSNSSLSTHRVDIPPWLFKGPVSDLEELFAKELSRQCHFAVAVGSMRFYKPHNIAEEPINENNLMEILPVNSLSRALNGELDSQGIHIVITAKQRHSIETTDVLSPLPESERFERTFATKGQAPSQAAKSNEYRSSQNTQYEVIYDGRYAPHGQDTTALPIYVYHRVFSLFDNLLQNPPQPTREDINNTTELMTYLCELSPPPEESRNNRIRILLGKILGVDIINPTRDGTTADGRVDVKIDDEKLATLMAEWKREPGEGGCDPATQAALGYKRACQGAEETVKRSCCPAFLIHGAGPWMAVSGAVFTDKVIIQQLTPMMWFGFASTHEDVRLLENTCVLLALREALKELQDFYQNKLPVDSWTPNTPHPRLYPYPTYYPQKDEDGKHGKDGKDAIVKFSYKAALEDDPRCVAFLAQTESEQKIVVKYVADYGGTVHKFLADRNYAPNLLYCGPLPDAFPVNVPLAAKVTIPGLCLQPMLMVVMEYIDAKPLPILPRKYRTQIEDILVILHQEGYVFGDLRNPNILIDPQDDRVKLIDFDWSGEYEKGKHNPDRLPKHVQDKIIDSSRTYKKGKCVHYPSTLSLSSKIRWAKGVGRLEPILPEHDWEMLERLQFS